MADSGENKSSPDLLVRSKYSKNRHLVISANLSTEKCSAALDALREERAKQDNLTSFIVGGYYAVPSSVHCKKKKIKKSRYAPLKPIAGSKNSIRKSPKPRGS
jgi:hypothetical protein